MNPLLVTPLRLIDILFAVDAIDNLPRANEPILPFATPTEPTILYEGRATLVASAISSGGQDSSAKHEIKIEGEVKIQLHLKPKPFRKAIFTTHDSKTYQIEINSSYDFTLQLPDYRFPIDVIQSKRVLFATSNPYRFEFEVVYSNAAKFRDLEDLIEIQFSLVNLPLSIGDTNITYTGNEICAKRIELHTQDGWEIYIDNRKNYDIEWEHAKEDGSYTVTHLGLIRRKDCASFDYNEVKDMLDCLYWFFTFVRSQRVGLILPIATSHDGTKTIIYYDLTHTDPAIYRPTWYDNFQFKSLSELFDGFHSEWTKPDMKDTISTLIGRYSHANNGYIDSGLVVAHSALETLAWLALVTTGKMSNRSFKDVSAGDKIEEILTTARVPLDFPTEYKDMEDKETQLSDVNGCQQMVSWVRNRIVHPKEDPPEFEVTYGAYCTALWYLELLLLNMFNFSGKYHNRTTNGVEDVPWSTYTGNITA